MHRKFRVTNSKFSRKNLLTVSTSFFLSAYSSDIEEDLWTLVLSNLVFHGAIELFTKCGAKPGAGGPKHKERWDIRKAKDVDLKILI